MQLVATYLVNRRSCDLILSAVPIMKRQFHQNHRFTRYVTLALVTLPLLAGAATGKRSSFDPELLRPADTSSPRATLTSFLNESRRVVEDLTGGARDEKTYRAFRRASQTLDYSSTPEGDTWLVRARRVALLQEVLSRVQLPPANMIPGDREIADEAITQWTIPDTSIRIVKIENGPRSGEFLFSADTVLRLDRFYEQIKDMPYRPGATTGIYEKMISGEVPTMHGQELELRNRLKPVNVSSPKATFEGFLDNVNRAYRIVQDAKNALQATPPALTNDEAREAEIKAASLLQRASETLDLRQIPEALRQTVSSELTLQLKEVFDRMLLPPVDSLPTPQMVAASRGQAIRSDLQSIAPYRWTVPNTHIEIIEVMEGDRRGDFLFSASTVKSIGSVYQKVKDLPYRPANFGGAELEYVSPGISPGFYESYSSTSGYLIPQAHLLGRLIDELPGWTKATYLGQMVWQWAGLIFSVLVTIGAVYAFYSFITSRGKRIRRPWQDWLRLVSTLVALLIVITLNLFISDVLKFTSSFQTIVTTIIASTVFVLAAWAAFQLCMAAAETISATPRMRYRSSETALLKIGARVVGVVIAVWIVIDGIRSLGADLIPLLAGLGIGGLAVALAAQSTIANFIGSLILLANKPVEVGDFCRYGEDPSADWLRIGTVEEINWISTRIRGIDRTVTTIPNAEFANMHIVNLTKRDQRLMKMTLQLRYETSAEQLRYILVRLRELLLGHPMVTPDPARVRFVGYAAYSKDIEIFCYLRCQEHNEFLAIQEDLLLRIENIIKEAGSGFAFPSQTAYIARDTGLDEERGAQAESEIETLRASGTLPFPEFDVEQREKLNDVLDYPPAGSPDYRPRSGTPDPDTDPQS